MSNKRKRLHIGFPTSACYLIPGDKFKFFDTETEKPYGKIYWCVDIDPEIELLYAVDKCPSEIDLFRTDPTEVDFSDLIVPIDSRE